MRVKRSSERQMMRHDSSGCNARKSVEISKRFARVEVYSFASRQDAYIRPLTYTMKVCQVSGGCGEMLVRLLTTQMVGCVR